MVIHGLLDSHRTCSSWSSRLVGINGYAFQFFHTKAAFSNNSCPDIGATRDWRADLAAQSRWWL